MCVLVCNKLRLAIILYPFLSCMCLPVSPMSQGCCVFSPYYICVIWLCRSHRRREKLNLNVCVWSATSEGVWHQDLYPFLTCLMWLFNLTLFHTRVIHWSVLTCISFSSAISHFHIMLTLTLHHSLNYLFLSNSIIISELSEVNFMVMSIWCCFGHLLCKKDSRV